jgi:hypothetical protein
LIPAAVGISEFKYDRIQQDSIEAARVEPSVELEESGLQPEIVRAAFIKYISPFADAIGKPLSKSSNGLREGNTIFCHFRDV